MRGTVAKRIRKLCKSVGWSKSDARKIKKLTMKLKREGKFRGQRGLI